MRIRRPSIAAPSVAAPWVVVRAGLSARLRFTAFPAPATARLAASSRVSLLGGARPLRLTSGTNDWTQERLIRTSERAWVEDPRGIPYVFDGAETRGIRALSIASERWTATEEGGKGRTVVLGSGQAFRGAELALVQDLLLGSLRWLMEEEASGGLVGIQELPFRPTAAATARIQNIELEPRLPSPDALESTADIASALPALRSS